MMWDLTISKSRGRYLQCCEVNGASKTRFTYPFTRAFTLPIEHAPAGEEVAHDRNAQLGRAQNTVLGWSDPTLGTFGCLKALWGRSSPARDFLRCAARIWAKQVKKVGITYFSFVFTIFFSL
jgi:hypothetical protein